MYANALNKDKAASYAEQPSQLSEPRCDRAAAAVLPLISKSVNMPLSFKPLIRKPAIGGFGYKQIVLTIVVETAVFYIPTICAKSFH